MTNKDKYNLDALSVQELTTLIADAENKRREKMDDAKSSLLAEMEQKAAALGLSLEGLVRWSQPQAARDASVKARKPRKPRKNAGAAVAAKFRGPGGEEWSGRGRPPTWLAALEDQGEKRENFRI